MCVCCIQTAIKLSHIPFNLKILRPLGHRIFIMHPHSLMIFRTPFFAPSVTATSLSNLIGQNIVIPCMQFSLYLIISCLNEHSALCLNCRLDQHVTNQTSCQKSSSQTLAQMLVQLCYEFCQQNNCGKIKSVVLESTIHIKVIFPRKSTVQFCRFLLRKKGRDSDTKEG